MRPVARQHTEASNCVFYPGVFNETLGLLFEAHSYFQENSAEEQALMPAHSRLFYASEMSRVTMRLTSIMAWLMVQKAVHAGRISEKEAIERYKLEAKEECLEHNPFYIEQLPYYIGYLSDRSHSLFSRVARLEAMIEDRIYH